LAYLVTGASSGIGRAVAMALAEQRQSVIAVARDRVRLETLEFESGGCVNSVVADLSSDAGLFAVFKTVESMTYLDGIVHAAGSHIELGGYEQLDADRLAADMRIHVSAPIALNNGLAHKLKKGRVLFIDSYSASNLRIGWGAYSIVKAAAQMAARLAAEELKELEVIRVFPGAVRTPLVEKVLQSKHHSPVVTLFKSLNASGQMKEPQVVGDFIANILIKGTLEQLRSREFWDIENEKDYIFA